MSSIIPAPVTMVTGEGEFVFGPTTGIRAFGAARAVGDYLAELLRPATGLPLPAQGHGEVELVIGSAPAPGGYSLRVTERSIRIEATDPAGLFAGVQTLRQLLPVALESADPSGAQDVAWSVPSVEIEDYPRFAYRGAMLDVARHFFGVDDVKAYVDRLALLKLNHLHLHLTDDQGWRIQIDGWPRLTEIGASTQVGGGGGGFFTQDGYREIVRYAASRYVTVVPEIDVPGHTNAALAAYPELTCDGVAPAPYEGTDVGFSSLCIGTERTYEFLEDVVAQVAAITPGPYLHLGGDESLSTTQADFLAFVERAGAIVARHGKTLIGWHEMGKSPSLPRGTVGQYWSFLTPQDAAGDHTLSFVEHGGQVIMSPADVAYLDIKYDEHTEYGLVWADGPTGVRQSRDWDPADVIPGLGDEQLLGVEAPLWTETVATRRELEFMALPRLAGIAEIAWSPRRELDWAEYSDRLSHFGRRLDAAGIEFYRSPEVSWR